jgi:hypothetical protein
LSAIALAIPASFLPCRFQTAAKAQFIREFRRAGLYSNAGPSIVSKAGRFMRNCERVGICGGHLFRNSSSRRLADGIHAVARE